jgi:hypothetical protein
MMTDSEAAAWTRGHAVGMKELKAAEQRWQVERAGLIAQHNAREDEADRARAEIQRLRAALEAMLVEKPIDEILEYAEAAKKQARNALKETK